MSIGDALPDRRKRKRQDPEDGAIEIDVSLPEPLSKKASRKAKKQKHVDNRDTQAVSTGDPTQAAPRSGSDSEEKKSGLGQVALVADTSSPTKGSTATYSIWIGNLPFTMTKPMLHTFLTTTAQPPLPVEAITRINIPTPARAAATRTTLKPQNKGFAYVDFSDHASFLAALAVSETPIAGRKVLIKDAKNFEGRPVNEPAATNGNGAVSKTEAFAQKRQKPPSKRVFVGNLGYDVTKDDLQEFYTRCGKVVDVHVATFEDSGKCKGFAWVRFETIEAASAAVQGYVRLDKGVKRQSKSGGDANGDPSSNASPSDNDSDRDSDGEDHGKTTLSKKPKPTKSQKWFVNRLQGRSVRCEFAEDPTMRYKKRFGKDVPRPQPVPLGAEDENGHPAGETIGEALDESGRYDNARKHPFGIDPGAPTDAGRRRGRTARPLTDQEQRRNAKAKEIQEKTRYRSGAVTESKGSKVVFE